MFYCVALRCTLRVRVCILRQAASRRQKTQQKYRGTASDFPTCTEECAQGCRLRSRVDGAEGVRWDGAGQGRRYVPQKRIAEKRGEMMARARLEAVGLLSLVPNVDEPPPEPDEGEA